MESAKGSDGGEDMTDNDNKRSYKACRVQYYTKEIRRSNIYDGIYIRIKKIKKISNLISKSNIHLRLRG
jgi:hypothetical protein